MGLNTSGGPHHTTHENGGSDEIDATGLTGVTGGGGGASASMQTHVYRNTGQVITTGTLTAISFDTQFRDDDGDWAITPNPTRVIITQDGTYDLVAGTMWDGNVAGTFRKIGLYKNGSLLHEYSHAPLSFLAQTVVDYSVALVNGDYIEVKVTQDSGSNSTIQAGNEESYVLVTRGGDESFIPFDVTKILRGPSPYGISQPALDGTSRAIISLPGTGTVNVIASNAGDYAELDVGFGNVYANASAEIFLEPGTSSPVVIDTGDGIVLPPKSSDPTAYDQGHIYYNDARHRFRVNRRADGSNDIWQDLVAQGNAPYAFPVGWVPSGTYTTAVTLAANGGSLACPILVPAPMVVTAVDIWNTDTTLAREFEANLYLDAWASTAVQAQGGSGGDAYTVASWTASVGSIKTADYGGSSPIWLEPGIVWLVIRNIHASNTLGVGSLAAAGTFSSILNSHQTKTLGSFLDTTLDLITGWSKSSAIPGVVLRGRLLGSAVVW